MNNNLNCMKQDAPCCKNIALRKLINAALYTFTLLKFSKSILTNTMDDASFSLDGSGCPIDSRMLPFTEPEG
jgi:hypothetical protein